MHNNDCELLFISKCVEGNMFIKLKPIINLKYASSIVTDPKETLLKYFHNKSPQE